MKNEPTLAFDKSSRHYDQDGRLHIDMTPISKGNVCGYFGREIPGWQTLGLDSAKIYQMYRHPDELAKAAPTFNNIQLLSLHKPVTADENPKALVCGSTGTDCVFDGTYLKNSLVVWDNADIAGIETAKKYQLSAAYHYKPVMGAGVTADGVPYDGVMTEIVGNHVALVEQGRAGADVVVADGGIAVDTFNEKDHPRDRNGKFSQGLNNNANARWTTVPPPGTKYFWVGWKEEGKSPGMTGLYGSQLASSSPWAFSSKEQAEKHRLAAKLDDDENIEDLTVFEDETADPDVAADSQPIKEHRMKTKKELLADILAPFLAADAAPDLDAILALAKDEKAEPDDDDKIKDGENEEEYKARMAGKKKVAADTEKDDKPTKAAMDEAITGAVAQAKAQMREIQAAEKTVAPIVGEVFGMDSAADVYKLALDHLKVDVAGVDPSAYGAMVRFAVANQNKKPAAMAQDSGEASLFPEAGKLKGGF